MGLCSLLFVAVLDDGSTSRGREGAKRVARRGGASHWDESIEEGQAARRHLRPTDAWAAFCREDVETERQGAASGALADKAATSRPGNVWKARFCRTSERQPMLKNAWSKFRSWPKPAQVGARLGVAVIVIFAIATDPRRARR